MACNKIVKTKLEVIMSENLGNGLTKMSIQWNTQGNRNSPENTWRKKLEAEISNMGKTRWGLPEMQQIRRFGRSWFRVYAPLGLQVKRSTRRMKKHLVLDFERITFCFQFAFIIKH